MKTDDNRCRECGTVLHGKNAIDVGYCIPCYNMMMADGEDEEDDEPEYYHCQSCNKTWTKNPGSNPCV